MLQKQCTLVNRRAVKYDDRTATCAACHSALCAGVWLWNRDAIPPCSDLDLGTPLYQPQLNGWAQHSKDHVTPKKYASALVQLRTSCRGRLCHLWRLHIPGLHEVVITVVVSRVQWGSDC